MVAGAAAVPPPNGIEDPAAEASADLSPAASRAIPIAAAMEDRIAVATENPIMTAIGIAEPHFHQPRPRLP